VTADAEIPAVAAADALPGLVSAALIVVVVVEEVGEGVEEVVVVVVEGAVAVARSVET
jgi:hypothetical protein